MTFKDAILSREPRAFLHVADMFATHRDALRFIRGVFERSHLPPPSDGEIDAIIAAGEDEEEGR